MKSFLRRSSHLLPTCTRAPLHAAKLWAFGGGGLIRKQETVRWFIRNQGARCFIETGTLVGDMVNAIRRDVAEVYSIEIDEYLFQACSWRFIFDKRVTILKGDSGAVLRELLPKINEKVVFWLDGHYSGSGTGRGSLETPIYSELEAIRSHHVKGHAILVDDVRSFGQGDYPSLQTLCEVIHTINPLYLVEVNDDILRAWVP